MSSNEKPTVEIDQLGIIRGLLERQETKMDTLGVKQDLLDTRFRGLETTTENVRTEVKRLNERMSHAEADIRDLRDQDGTILRQTSSNDLAHDAAIGGAIAHVRTLEEAVETTAK